MNAELKSIKISGIEAKGFGCRKNGRETEDGRDAQLKSTRMTLRGERP